MYTNRILPVKSIFRFSFLTLALFSGWSALIVGLYTQLGCRSLAIPFLPIATIGTALAFYLSMKNNSAYDRLWEGRKIWGAIVNDSRAFAAMLNAYISSARVPSISESRLQELRLELAQRHIAWIYAHGFFLRHRRQPWEHQHKHTAKMRNKYLQEFDLGSDIKKTLQPYLSSDECQQVIQMASPPSQLLNLQSLAFRKLRAEDILDDFRLFEMQNHINKLLEHQGRNERIKNFPFPRQFSWMAGLVIAIFCLILPFGLLNEMHKQGEGFVWLTVPFSAIISWVFIFMDQNADYTENPYNGLPFDIPISSISRNIEIDMLQMLGQTDTPPPIAIKDGVLM